MQGQVFTVAKLHYINGVVYFVAQEGSTDLSVLAKHTIETTKSGNVMHPVVRVRTLVRLAEGLGLVLRLGKETIQITELGKRYYEARAEDKWSLSSRQKEMLRDHILFDPSRSPTIHSVTSLLSLVKKGHTGKELSRYYAAAIGKQDAWQSDVTYEGFTKFGMNYLKELEFIERGVNLEHFDTEQKTVVTQTRIKKTFLFTWNPSKWKWDDLPRAVYEANAEGRYLDRWSCGVTKNISPGDRAFLLRLGVHPKGIMGSGVIVSEPFDDIHWDLEKAERGETVNRVEILFDVLSDLPIISEETLISGELGIHDWFPHASGTCIPGEIADRLERLWTRTTGTVFNTPEIADISSLRIEGTRRSRWVTISERNSKAREECLRHHGTICYVCGLLFEEKYGLIGKGFIHVHHAVPMSEIQHEYKVDPVNDLSPVCPNCHAMLHKRTPPYSITELKVMMTDSRNGLQPIAGSTGQP